MAEFDLNSIKNTAWVDRRDGRIGLIADTTDPEFTFLGRRYNVSHVTHKEQQPCQIIAFYDQWKISELLRYDPLIYWVACGPPHSFELLKTSMSSLAEFGAYTGKILVLSDKPREYVEYFIDPAFKDRWLYHRSAASTIIEYTMMRYKVYDVGHIQKYQPALYIDTDVIFDAPIDALLGQIITKRRIVGQGNSGPLWRDMGVGAHLLAEDGYTFSHDYPYLQGFCSGTLGIPNIADHGQTLMTIEDAIARYCQAKRDEVIGWYDQPTANYVLFKLFGECPDLLDRYVRWGGKRALHGGDRPLGLVHLWGGVDKLAEMNELLEMLRGNVLPAHQWSVWGSSGLIEKPVFPTEPSGKTGTCA